MKSFRYMIIGGGITAAYAIKGIREKDSKGSIGILTKEAFGPYNRPYLSKDLWKGKPVESIWIPIEDENTELLTNHQVVQININEKRVITQSKEEFGFQTLLKIGRAHV